MAEPNILMVGTVRVRDGAEEICINPYASYGGGGGPLWARVGAEAQLTTDKTWAYIRGICRGISPDRKAIQFEITHSRHTWGTFAAGQTISLRLDEIARYDDFFRLTEGDLEVVPERLRQHLQWELPAELEQRFRDAVGAQLYDAIAELQDALDRARDAYTNLPRNFERGSVRNWNKAKKRLSTLMKSICSGEQPTGDGSS
jgi:hypothetical protein